MKDLLLQGAVSQKDERPLITVLDDTARRRFKIKITETPLEKKLNTAIPQAPMSLSFSFAKLDSGLACARAVAFLT